MKRFSWTFGLLIVAGVATAIAQPPGGPGGRGGPGGGPPPGGGRGRPPQPVIEALDADGNHIISSEELQNATKVLLALDKNHDGQLSEDEFGPGRDRPGMGREPGGPPGGNRGGGENSRRPPRGPDGPRDRRPGGEPGNDDRPPHPPGPERMIEHAFEFDADRDGKLSKEELTKFAEDFEQHHRGPGGPPRDGGEGRPGGPGPRDDKEPQRPKRPD